MSVLCIVRVVLSAGSMGCIPQEQKPVGRGPCPFGPSLAARFGLLVITTVQPHVQALTHRYLAHKMASSGSRFSCCTPLARPRQPGVKRLSEGGAVSSTPLGWELDGYPHPLGHQVVKGVRAPLPPIILEGSKFRENGSQSTATRGLCTSAQ